MRKGGVRLTLITLTGLLAAGATLAGGSGGTGGLPEGGTLVLRTGTNNQFDYYSTSQWNALTGAPPASLPASDATQLVGASTASGQKCWLTPTLGNLMQLGPNASNTNVPRPGFVGGSIGIFGGGNSPTARGTACSRVGGSETLVLTLGTNLSAFEVLKTRLNVEVKQNAWILATAKRGGQVVATYELQTGSSIGLPAVGALTVTPNTCSASSDSGPDSGPNDNCDWQFEGVPYDTIELSAVAGEFSWEGGGDYSTSVASAHYSVFELVRADGAIGCAPGNNEAFEINFDVASHVTRVDTCSIAIPYLLQHEQITGGSFSRLVDFFTDSTNPNQEYNIDIKWNPTEVASVADLGIYTYWWVDPLDPKPLELCLGTLTPITDADGRPAVSVTGDGQGSPYACLLGQTVDELGPGSVPGTFQVQVSQTIYLRGDPTFGGR